MSSHVKFQDSNIEENTTSDSCQSEIEESDISDEEKCSNSENEGENHIMNGMSIEALLKIREKIGTKAFTEKIAKRNLPSSSIISKKSHTKRANKNRPVEVPIMRKRAPKMKFFVTKKNEVTNVPQLISRDPRFDDISGKLDITAWKKNYSFIHDKRTAEKKSLKTTLKHEKDLKKCNLIKKEIQKMDNQEREFEKSEKEREFKTKQRNNAIQSLQEGKTPKFASKKDVKSYMNESYMEKLKKENKVEKYHARKEKKQQNKEFKRFGKNTF